MASKPSNSKPVYLPRLGHIRPNIRDLILEEQKVMQVADEKTKQATEQKVMREVDQVNSREVEREEPFYYLKNSIAVELKLNIEPNISDTSNMRNSVARATLEAVNNYMQRHSIVKVLGTVEDLETKLNDKAYDDAAQGFMNSKNAGNNFSRASFEMNEIYFRTMIKNEEILKSAIDWRKNLFYSARIAALEYKRNLADESDEIMHQKRRRTK